eukprot:UN34839
MLEITPPFKNIKSEEKFVKMSKRVAVVGGYFGGETTENEHYNRFIESAVGMKRRNDLMFAVFSKEKPNFGKRLVNGTNNAVLYNENQKYYFNFEAETEEKQRNFTTWLQVYVRPLIDKYSYDLKKN